MIIYYINLEKWGKKSITKEKDFTEEEKKNTKKVKD